jgi:hypothetical protein
MPGRIRRSQADSHDRSGPDLVPRVQQIANVVRVVLTVRRVILGEVNAGEAVGKRSTEGQESDESDNEWQRENANAPAR